MEDFETKLLTHIGDRFKEINKSKPRQSRLQNEKDESARQELKMILNLIQENRMLNVKAPIKELPTR